MNQKYLIILALWLCYHSLSHAQFPSHELTPYHLNANRNWGFRDNHGLKWNTSLNQMDSFGIIHSQHSPLMCFNSIHANRYVGMLSDPINGDLLWYIDGFCLRNKNNDVTPNGDIVKGPTPCMKEHCIKFVPNPKDSNLFYLFTVPYDHLESHRENVNIFNTLQIKPDGVYMHTIDRRMDNGLGDMVDSLKNIELFSYYDYIDTNKCLEFFPMGCYTIPGEDTNIWLVFPVFIRNIDSNVHATIESFSGLAQGVVWEYYMEKNKIDFIVFEVSKKGVEFVSFYEEATHYWAQENYLMQMVDITPNGKYIVTINNNYHSVYDSNSTSIVAPYPNEHLLHKINQTKKLNEAFTTAGFFSGFKLDFDSLSLNSRNDIDITILEFDRKNGKITNSISKDLYKLGHDDSLKSTRRFPILVNDSTIAFIANKHDSVDIYHLIGNYDIELAAKALNPIHDSIIGSSHGHRRFNKKSYIASIHDDNSYVHEFEFSQGSLNHTTLNTILSLGDLFTPQINLPQAIVQYTDTIYFCNTQTKTTLSSRLKNSTSAQYQWLQVTSNGEKELSNVRELVTFGSNEPIEIICRSLSYYNNCMYIEEGKFTLLPNQEEETLMISVNENILHVDNIFDRYEWYIDNTPIPNSNSHQLTVDRNGIYKVKVWYMKPDYIGSCELESEEYKVNNATSIQDISSSIEVSPNPVYRFINIHSSQASNIKIYDFSGKIVLEQPLNNPHLDVGHLIPGIYYIQLFDSNFKEIYGSKFVKQ